ncbi:MAG TPA: hypothetical protein VG474_14845, partial [Solirubrobacteraceae bacterium]|nr:hypothetical protein [Solirubrobacteraceae bacterium]
MRVANNGERSIRDGDAVLLARPGAPAGFFVSAAADPLRQPLAPGSVAANTLRFEIAPALADALARARRAQLSIAGETVQLTFRVRRATGRRAAADPRRAATRRPAQAAAPPPRPRRRAA